MNESERCKAADRIATILRQHPGIENAVHAMAIGKAVSLSDREVRQIIADEDWEVREMLVCAAPGIGYFVAQDVAEITDYHKYLCLLRDKAARKESSFARLCAKLGIFLPPHRA